LITVGVKEALILNTWETGSFQETKAGITRQTVAINFVIGFTIGIDGLADIFLIFIKSGRARFADSLLIIGVTAWISHDNALGNGTTE
jgi:hypothetical protein